jgi:hypothetical protein
MLSFYVAEQIEEEKKGTSKRLKTNEKCTDVSEVKERKEKVNQVGYSNQ